MQIKWFYICIIANRYMLILATVFGVFYLHRIKRLVSDALVQSYYRWLPSCWSLIFFSVFSICSDRETSFWPPTKAINKYITILYFSTSRAMDRQPQHLGSLYLQHVKGCHLKLVRKWTINVNVLWTDIFMP